MVQPFENDFRENPYLMQKKSLMNSSKHRSICANDSFSFIDNYIFCEVFFSVYEHLATVADISGGPALKNKGHYGRNQDDNNKCIF